MCAHLAKNLLVSIVLLAACTTIQAQKQNILLVIKDSADKKPLSKATAVMISKKDSVFLDFGVADSLGKFLFKNVNLENVGVIVISSTGYNDKRILLQVPAATGKARLPERMIEVLLSPHFMALEDVVVTGKSSPVKMNKDTLEFNAEFFKPQPNAVLEDLLRKLPGVELRNGNEVYINGQRVSRILVDGKEFFSTDPLIILKNLPADIIAKVQVADEKNTIAKETREQQDIPKILNLKLKKEIRSGLFGKVYGGYGTNSRYEAGGLLNTFRDTLQMSLIGTSSNQGRGGTYLQDMGGQFGGNLSGNYGDGIQTSHLAGLNVSYAKRKSLTINGQYTYSLSNRRSASESLNQQFINDSVLLSRSANDATSNTYSQKAGASLRWKQDSTGYLSAQVNAEWANGRQQGNSGTHIYSETVPLLSRSAISNQNTSSRSNHSAKVDFSRTFVRLHLDWSVYGNYTNANAIQVSETDSRYIRLLSNFVPDSVIQQRENNSPNQQWSIGNSLSKNWKDRNSIIWKTDYSNTQDVTGGDTYQFSKTSGENELVPSLSVKLKQHKIRWNNQFSYRYNYKKFSIQPGILVRNLYIQNSYNYDTIPVLNRTYNLVTPTFTIYYKGIGFSYSRNLQEPSAYSVRPVTDSSNPLYITSGNPDLRPAKSSAYSLNYYRYFNRAKISFNTWGSFNRQTDAIGTSRQVFADGKTITGYVNLESVKNYSSAFYLSKSYSKNNWNYSVNISNNFYITQSPVVLNQRIINTVATSLSPNVGVYIGYKNKYRFSGGYRVSINRSKSDDSTVKVANNSQHTVSGTLHIQFLKWLAWDANANYNINPGTPAGFQKQWLFCDMSLTASFLKKERAQLKLSGYDIFNQNQGISRYAYQNYIVDNKSLVQRQYFMLTLLYTVRKI